jgi:DNA polymerase-3 subunit epsilon
VRQIILDTETTGLNARLGDRIIEIGCIELHNRRFTGNHLHHYVNPERDSEEGALAVHGISNEFLQDKPKFAEIAAEFIEYVRGAELIIHNAAFDVEFLNRELSLLGMPPIEQVCSGVIDTLRQARELHPGKKNSLDALCERYAIDHSRRTLHGALLDAELLAEVYLAMTRGQDSLAIELDQPRTVSITGSIESEERPVLIVLLATADETAEHQRLLAGIDKESKGRCLWRKLEAVVAPAELPQPSV